MSNRIYIYIYAYLCIAAGQKILDHLAKIQKMEQRVKDQKENDQEKDQTNSGNDGCKILMPIPFVHSMKGVLLQSNFQPSFGRVQLLA